MASSEAERQTIREWSTISEDAIAALDPEGDHLKKHLLNPTVFRMLGDVSGAEILDAGSGQGYFSRLLAQRGARVTSVEPAKPMFEHSVRMEQRLQQGITLRQLDLTDASFDPVFDAVVANMVYLSVPNWEAAMQACVHALRPGGLLVFSVDHPCFEIGRRHDDDPSKLTVENYLEERPIPKHQATDFHRTISTYLNAVVRAGCQVREIAEPGLESTLATDPKHQSLVHFPCFLVVAAQKTGGAV